MTPNFKVHFVPKVVPPEHVDGDWSCRAVRYAIHVRFKKLGRGLPKTEVYPVYTPK